MHEDGSAKGISVVSLVVNAINCPPGHKSERAFFFGCRMNDQDIEQEIQAKGKTAPRVTPADVEANIASAVYFTAFDGFQGSDATEDESLATCDPVRLLTFCVLVLRNGFTVTGESACASPDSFDAEIGRKVARTKAVEKIWPLLDYELRSKLAATA